MEPYVLADGEGRSYRWHDVVFTMKAAAPETGGAFALWDVTTRPGEEPHTHVHDDVHEMFYLLSGDMTFFCAEQSFRVGPHAFVFVPIGTPHTYKIHSEEARLIGISSPSALGDNIEATGERIAPRLSSDRDFEAELLGMIDAYIAGGATFAEFKESYYFFYVDVLPDDALTDQHREFFGDVQEKLDWTATAPVESTDRKYGWRTVPEYTQWLAEARGRYREQFGR